MVNHAGGATQLTVNQMAGGGDWALLGTFDFNSGSATISVTDQANGYVIADAVMLLPPGAAPNSATWTPNVAQAGQYELYARWTSHANRASNATYTVTHAAGSTFAAVNQQANGGVWNLLGTFALSPGTAHKVTLTDQANGYVIADAIRLVPVSLQSELKLHFVHVDHLNTPRLVADDTGTTVWRWDQAEPFGVNVPDENPSGLGAFDLPLRLPGQYFDKETNLHYNYFRDYDPGLGIFKQSDPIGLRAGLNTYSYVRSSPLLLEDFFGLQALGEEPRGSPVPGFPNISAQAQRSLVKQVQRAVNDICRVDDKNDDHRGRIQAQGGGYEDAVPWAQGNPLSLIDGHVKLDTLVARMPPREKRARRFAIEEARVWIDRAGRAGGVSAEVIKPFYEPGGIRGERIDIEVRKGRAFVP